MSTIKEKVEKFLLSRKAYKDALSDIETEVGVLMQTMSEFAKKYNFPSYNVASFNSILYYREELKKIEEMTERHIFVKTSSKNKIFIPTEFLYLSTEELENKYKAEAVFWKYENEPKTFFVGMNVQVCNQDYEPHYNGRIGFVEAIENTENGKQYRVGLYPLINDEIVYDKELSEKLLYLSENEINIYRKQ